MLRSVRHSVQRLCSTSAAAAADADATSQPPATFLEIAARAAANILGDPRYESRLLSLLPGDLLFHPDCVRLALSHVLPSPDHSLRFLRFLSSHLPAPAPAPDDAAEAPSPPLPGVDGFLIQLWPPDAVDAAEVLASRLGLHPSLGVLHCAMRTALRAARPDLVFRLFSAFSSSPDFPGDAATVAFLVRACAADGRPHDGLRLQRDGARRGLPPSLDAIADLVAAFSAAGNFGKVSETLHLMIAAGTVPDTFIYQRIMHGLFAHGLGSEALRVFNDIKLRGYHIDAVTYTTAIDGLCKMGCIDEARGVWSEMVGKGMEPNEHAYCSLLDYHCKAGDFVMAHKVYDEMLGKGLKESTVSCNIMVTGFCVHGRLDEALGMFEEMVKRGIRHDVITYNILIQGLCKAGKLGDAIQVYEQLLSSGLEPSVSTFTPLIDTMCEEGQVDSATEFLKLMHAKGLVPLVRTNDSILNGFCKARRAEDGMAWLAGMLKNNLKPREQTFNSLVELLSSSGQVDDALLVLNLMLKIGHELGSLACTMLVEKLCTGKLFYSHELENILATN
ncbi:pentatricopeptide repeat-containing protein At5g18950-like [Oryza brachyantha]|nr:pentatricopeptide repeat-containing protein At5g18950-like [Oryza brachyantha]XP_040377477.1 pentatricopeptide repeat-containing protein At5g18950-like [Oryza brachyantha]XP_040377478.1 pentatricopeptide repeat-containing protein At5g18950-like [Oryza brachyantha]XP_040377479.1 pentatricopeptide repeat-containing protein At5g18950-like [Oryza brachyantha]XP_040377480.1 pentatricopeptide repeat-containing protein At5g18950-like [Oryza brachyantha]XP_040377481.1 pentatricopeptide repeat-conta